MDEVLSLDPGLIIVSPDRLRGIDDGKAREIATSMRQAGQIQPISVTPADAMGHHTLIAGGHRWRAAMMNGGNVKAVIFEGDRDAARLREIDENLFRRDLDPLDQAVFLAERREIFERRSGSVKAGRPRKEIGATSRQFSFFDDTTSQFGLTRDVIERALRRYFRLDPDVRKRIAGTRVAINGKELDALIKEPPERQRKIADLLLRDEHAAKNVRTAIRALDDDFDVPPDSDDQALRRLTEAWRKATPKARASFIDFLVDQKAINRASGYRAARVHLSGDVSGADKP